MLLQNSAQPLVLETSDLTFIRSLISLGGTATGGMNFSCWGKHLCFLYLNLNCALSPCVGPSRRDISKLIADPEEANPSREVWEAVLPCRVCRLAYSILVLGKTHLTKGCGQGTSPPQHLHTSKQLRRHVPREDMLLALILQVLMCCLGHGPGGIRCALTEGAT